MTNDDQAARSGMGFRTARSAVHIVHIVLSVPSVSFVPALVVLLALVLGFSSVPSQAGGVAAAGATQTPPPQKPDAKPKHAFPPEVEAKFAEFLKKVKEARGKVWEIRITKEIDEIAKATGLNAEGMAALEAASKKPIAACLDEWIVKWEDLYRTTLPRAPSQLFVIFDQAAARIDVYASREFGLDTVEPADDPKWKAAVRGVLPHDQAATWEKALAERKLARAKAAAAYLKPMIDGVRENFRRMITARSGKIAQVLKLPKERADALNALGASAAEKSAEEWLKRAAKMLASMPDEQRQRLSRFGLGMLATQAPDQQALWKDGLANFLTKEEKERLEVVKNEQRSRRHSAFARILIVEMDQKVAFTANQRERLMPIAERLVEEAAFFPEDPPDELALNLQPQTFLFAGANAPEKEMAAILDPTQSKHWKDASDPKNTTTNHADRIVRNPAVVSEPDDAPPPPEPEEFEEAISDLLFEKTTPARAQMLAAMTLKAEDAARLGGLALESSRRLQVAARGAVEESLRGWKTGVDFTVRSQMENTNLPTSKGRLATIQDYVFERVAEVKPEKDSIWDKAVQTEMTAEQRAKWQKAVNERNAFKSRGIASLVLAEFDRKIGLSAEQREKLDPILASVTAEYALDIGSIFSMGNSNRWYLQNYTMFIPIAGVPLKNLKAILTKEQFDRWKTIDESSNAENYWTNIQQRHTQQKAAE